MLRKRARVSGRQKGRREARLLASNSPDVYEKKRCSEASIQSTSGFLPAMDGNPIVVVFHDAHAVVFPTSILSLEAKLIPGLSVLVDPANSHRSRPSNQPLICSRGIRVNLVICNAQSRNGDDPNPVADFQLAGIQGRSVIPLIRGDSASDSHFLRFPAGVFSARSAIISRVAASTACSHWSEENRPE